MTGMDERQRQINEAMQTDTRPIEAASAALLKLADYNIPPDILELLIQGNPDRGIRPGALVAALSMAIGVYTRL